MLVTSISILNLGISYGACYLMLRSTSKVFSSSIRKLMIAAWMSTTMYFTMLAAFSISGLLLNLYFITLSSAFMLLGVLFFLLATRRIYASITTEKKAAPAIEEALLREDLQVLKAFMGLTNNLLKKITPTSGVTRIKEVLGQHMEDHPVLFQGWRIDEDGLLSTEHTLTNLDIIHREERIPELRRTFSGFNSSLMELYSTATSPSLAEKVLVDSVRNLSATHLEVIYAHTFPFEGGWQQVVYRHGLILGAPIEAANSDKAKSMVWILFKDILEPLLRDQSRSALNSTLNLIKQKSGNAPLFSNFTVGNGGMVNVGPILVDAEYLSAEDVVEEFASVFKSCYANISSGVNNHTTELTLSEAFKGVLDRCGDAVYQHGIEKIIPNGALDDLREWTGIPGLNRLVEGGLPTGKVILLSTYGSADITLIAEQFLRSGLIRGDSCIYVVSREPAEHIRSRMLHRGWDPHPHEKSRRMVWVDCFSSSPPEQEDVVIRVDSMDNLPEVRLGITQGIDALKGKSYRIVLDVLSVLIERHAIREVFAFAHEIIARFKERGASVLVLLDGDMHDDRDVARIAHLCDGVLRLEQLLEEDEDGVERGVTYLSVSSFRGVEYDPRRVHVIGCDDGLRLEV